MKPFNLIIIIVFVFCYSLSAQKTEVKEKVVIYNPSADAAKDIVVSVVQAKKQNKHVLIQIGGNWCSWCIKFHKFIHAETQIDSIIKTDYIFLLVNYSKENKNLDVLKRLDFPQRFGFPVLVVLDGNGKRLHTQDSGFLEKEDGYDVKKVKTFLLTWNRGALDPEKYKEKKE